MNNNHQKPKKSPVNQRGAARRESKMSPNATRSHRTQRNAAMGYPSQCSLRRSGPKRKPTRNGRHWLMAGELAKAKKSGDVHQIALRELVLARTSIPEEHFTAEPELLDLTFVPYRFMSGYQRTQEFGRIFDELYREYRKRYWAKDTRLAPRTQLHTWPDGDIVALWQARQHADVLGLPYRYYIRQVFEQCLAAGYKRCPAPNQLWRDPVLRAVETEAKRSMGLTASKAYHPDELNPMFLAENYQGHPVQIAAHDDLVAKIKTFPDQFKLGAILMQHKIMPEAVARERFGDPLIDKTLAEYTPFKPRVLGEPLSVNAHPLLGCFGTYRAVSDVCQVCSLAASCMALDADVRATLVARHGTEAPRSSKQTRDATERKRRQRARERLDREAGRHVGSEDGLQPVG